MPNTDAPARPQRKLLTTTVRSTEQLTPHLIRVVVDGDDLAGFAVGEFTDHYVKLRLPPPGVPYAAPFDVEEIQATYPRDQWPRTRTYTVQDFDAATNTLTIDFVVHGDEGVAGPWAANVQPGDTLHLLGPGGAYAPSPDADWHLLVGDLCVIPAIQAALRRIGAGVPVHVIVEVESAADEVALQTPGDLSVTWLHTAAEAREDALVDAVRAYEFPDGAVHAFVHGEAAAVRAVRKHLLADRGLDRDALHCSGYWKRTSTDEQWRELKRDWNAQVEEDVPAA